MKEIKFIYKLFEIDQKSQYISAFFIYIDIFDLLIDNYDLLINHF